MKKKLIGVHAIARAIQSKRLELLEALEQRTFLSVAGYRTYDGGGNNLNHPSWGTPGDQEVRLAPSQYADGISAPSGATRPGARDISNQILQQHQAEDIFNSEGMSAFVYAWGQFIDHDLDLTSDATPAEPMNISVPTYDPSFDINGTGTQLIGFNRSEHVPGTGVTSPRETPNDISAYLDGSNVYGSDPVRARALRTLHNGQLKSSDNGQQLPYNVDGLPNQTAGGPASAYFLGGDVRTNENSELTSLQVLFMREHNRIATKLHHQHAGWNDEKLYQEARKLVVAEIQQITYNEFIPSFMGKNALPAYQGYKPNVKAQISNEFAAAAYRFGHSILGDDVQFFDNDSNTTLDDLKLADTFFQPSQQLNGGTDGLLKYLASVSSQEMDLKMVGGIRNFLFGPPGAGGFDLSALDVQRARDHGLADFNTTRAAMGLPKLTNFNQFGGNSSYWYTLENAYGNVNNVDLFVGGLGEEHLPGSALGPTFQRIMADQFRRTRDGDRFWYQNYLTNDEMSQVKGVTLSDIICKNSTIHNLQKNSFVFDTNLTGKVFNDINGDGKQQRNEPGVADQWVYMFDDDEVGIANAKTAADGSWAINTIQVGNYHLTTDVPDGSVLTRSPAGSYTFTRSQSFANANFGQHVIATQPTHGTTDAGQAGTGQTDPIIAVGSVNNGGLDKLFNIDSPII